MKNQLLIVLFILGFLHVGKSQTDRQWLVRTGNGKSGYSSGLNQYSSNQVGNVVTLQNIQHPNNAVTPPTRNDIFVIYDDGSFFNTRVDAGQDGLFKNFDPNQLNHALSAPPGRTIQYLYLTNIYDEDDPPDLVRAVSGQSNPSDSYNLKSSTVSGGIKATHNVVPSKDITLIIDKQSLGAVRNTLSIGFLPNGATTPIPGDYLVPSPIFPGDKFSNADGVAFISNSTIQILDPNLIPGPYLFINLKPTSSVNFPSTLPDHPDHLVFKITGDGHPDLNWSEAILTGYDPNHMLVNKICEFLGEQLINYHFQFQNTGRAEAKDLCIKAIFPDEIETNCIGSYTFSLNGKSVDGTIKVSGQKVEFMFNKDAAINPCRPNQDPQSLNCIGSVDFCVKLKNGVNPAISKTENLSLRPIVVEVSFGKDKFPLNDFFENDIFYKEGDHLRKIHKDESCDCACAKTLKKIMENEVNVYIKNVKKWNTVENQ